MNELKRCGTCGESKTIDNFHKNKSTYDGLSRQCSKCFSLYMQKRNLKRKEIKRKKLIKLYSFKGNRIKYKRKKKLSLEQIIKNKWHSITGARNRAKMLASAYQDDYSYLIAEWCKGGNFTCVSCNKTFPAEVLSIHHKIRLCDGGNDSADNVQPVCWACHNHFNKYGLVVDIAPKREVLLAPYKHLKQSPFRKIIKRFHRGKYLYYYYLFDNKGHIRSSKPLPKDYEITDKSIIIKPLAIKNNSLIDKPIKLTMAILRENLILNRKMALNP